MILRLCSLPVPRGPPINIEVVRLNGTHMSVRWMRLRLEIARGIPTNYTIIYSPIVAAMKRQAMSVNVAGDMNSVVIGGLSVAKQYSVSVSASTSAGPGPFSAPETVPSEKSSIYQHYYTFLQSITHSQAPLAATKTRGEPGNEANVNCLCNTWKLSTCLYHINCLLILKVRNADF